MKFTLVMKSKQAKNIYIAVISCLFGIWVLWYLGQVNDVEKADDFKKYKKQAHIIRTNFSEKKFTILFFGKPVWFDLSIDVFDKCSYKNCKLTTDKNLFSTSEAVIFHHDTFLPIPDKLSGQVWIFATLESPYHTEIFRTDDLRMKFNWTMTYRKDSEGFSPYALLRKQLHIPIKNYTSIFRNKTKNVAWVVSHCETPSKREVYVKELSKYIDVDVYGKCGKSCLFKNKDDCKKYLSKTYKFYLSFENSLCKDYLTEKILSMYVNGMNFIPIVRGAPNARDYLPNGTYISAFDFQSPKQLAAYLQMIGSDETRYILYLKEKEKYTDNGNGMFQEGICNICYHLNVKHQKPKTIDLNTWLWKNQCHMPTDIPT
ncbi:glycoprotein 3-alpha-L-fucosyltransferase A-like [Mytilus edulis]|uniref:glycoprotein 3-alpha-L-fucosyltransferase A-like n=1 Tax=Mytilus edulis TaxID=6550 RepID=UPI0039EF651C